MEGDGTDSDVLYQAVLRGLDWNDSSPLFPQFDLSSLEDMTSHAKVLRVPSVVSLQVMLWWSVS